MERLGVHLTTCVMLGTLLAVGWVVGWRAVLAIHIPIAVLAASLGMWLFHVQHAYETTYWKGHEEWDYFAAAAVGSSYYRLPKILQWFTANIGFHHIHHLDSRIPNYRLPDCFDAFPELQQARTLTLVDSLRCASLSLWDEDQGRLIRFDELASSKK
jgi:omega-6 fatty acid desaturase (delta-12 desaturase)